MTLPSFMYGDPSRVLERLEGQSCDGCGYKNRLWGLEYCDKHESQRGRRNMRRCTDFKPAERSRYG